ECCRHRKCGLPHRRELANENLALDLQSHEKEEDGHEAIVHYLVKCESRMRRGDTDGYPCLPERVVPVRPRRIRPYERNCRANKQNHPARRAGLHHAAQRSRYVVNERPFHAYSLARWVRKGRARMHPRLSL